MLRRNLFYQAHNALRLSTEFGRKTASTKETEIKTLGRDLCTRTIRSTNAYAVGY